MRERSRTAIAFLVVALSLVAWATLTPRKDAGATLASGGFCLWCGASRITDAFANIALFLPLGAALVTCGLRVRGAVFTVALVSLTIELAQLAGVPGGRVPSLADLLTNVTGGVAGALLAWQHRALLAPSPRRAAALALGWSACCALLLVATAWAVGDALPGARVSTVAPRASALPFTPGYGWFQGTVAGAMVSGVELRRRGNGPAIVEAPPTARLTAIIAVIGRDRRTDIVPMLYVHHPGDSLPALMIAQRGRSTLLRAGSNAGRMGLASPDLAVAHATSAAESVSDTVLVTARVSSRELFLLVEDAMGRRSATALRTPTVGWAFIQSLVPLHSPRRGWLTAAWLLLLIAPIGYWGWWSSERRAYVIAGATLLVVAATVGSVGLFALAPPPRPDWYAMACGLAAGLLLGRTTHAYKAPVTRAR